MNRRQFLPGALVAGGLAILAARGGSATPGAPSSVAGQPSSAAPPSAAAKPSALATSPSPPSTSALAKPAASAAPSGGGGLEKVMYATSPGFSTAQTYVGVGRGCYKDAGIDLDIEPQGSGTALRPQLATARSIWRTRTSTPAPTTSSPAACPMKFVADGGHDEKGYTAVVLRKELADSGVM